MKGILMAEEVRLHFILQEVESTAKKMPSHFKITYYAHESIRMLFKKINNEKILENLAECVS